MSPKHTFLSLGPRRPLNDIYLFAGMIFSVSLFSSSVPFTSVYLESCPSSWLGSPENFTQGDLPFESALIFKPSNGRASFLMYFLSSWLFPFALGKWKLRHSGGVCIHDAKCPERRRIQASSMDGCSTKKKKKSTERLSILITIPK